MIHHVYVKKLDHAFQIVSYMLNASDNRIFEGTLLKHTGITNNVMSYEMINVYEGYQRALEYTCRPSFYFVLKYQTFSILTDLEFRSAYNH